MVNLRLIFVQLCIASTVVLVSCGGSNGEEEEVLDNPIYASINDSIKKFPKNDSLLVERGVRLAMQKQTELSIKDLKNAWQINQSEKNGYALSQQLINGGKLNDAQLLLTQLIKLYPQNIIFYERLGQVYEQQGQPQNAIAQYDMILSKVPDAYEIMAAKGSAYEQLNKADEAITWYKKAYDGLPSLAIGVPLAYLYAETKNTGTPAFCDLLAKNTPADSRNADPQCIKGAYYNNIGNKQAALQAFNDAIKIDEQNGEAILEKGIIEYDLKQYDNALKTLLLCETLLVREAEVKYHIGKCFEAKGNKSEAQLYYERALALDKNFSFAQEALAKLKSK
jgi:tetratricopeptide (TPR) repeat protein